MKKLLLTTALLAAGLAAPFAHAADSDFGDEAAVRPITLAVFGDWPYNQNLLDNSKLLTDSINADRSVNLVMHVGDIHSGSAACTSADILPPIPASNPNWSLKVYQVFQQFAKPLVYTPGDNEWTDCHKSKEKSSGAPLKELAAVRSLFFARAGHSLGLEDKALWSQAQHYDAAYPADAQFVENTLWMDGRVLFVTLNVPGSNNDTVAWTGNFADPAAQAREVAERDAANQRWLETAFALADKHHARAVVIGQQADMWDPEAVAANELTNYTPYVQKLADLATAFGRPVLLLNGDSHVYMQDTPLADPASATGMIHHTQAVPNLTRITVQGSTNGPAEWLRLSIDVRKPQPFSWRNVAYCKDPLGSCK